MTREEAINLLESYLGISPEPLTDTVEERMAALEIAVEALKHDGWHPASEKPVIPKDKEDIWLYCLVYGEDKDEKVLAPMFLRYTKLLTFGWVLPDDMIVVWWCYPPEMGE